MHYAGVGCEMDTIMDIAARHHLYVIEDAACLLYTSDRGNLVLNMLARIRFCKLLGKLQEPFVTVDFRAYKDIYCLLYTSRCV